MRILVTGSEGLLGGWTVPALREAGHEVTTLDIKARPFKPGGDGLDASYHIAGDLRDISVARNAVPGMDVVVHLAAMPFDAALPDEVLAINVPGTWNICAACQEAGVPRIVYASSINALGAVGGYRPAKYLPIDDAYPCHPMPGYQLSKYLSDEICRSYTYRYGITTLSLRFGLIVAPPSPDPSSRRRWSLFGVPPEFRLRMGRDEYWAYVDVRDAANAVLKACSAEGVEHDEFLIFADDSTVDVPTAQLVAEHYPDTPWPNISLEAYVADAPYRSLMDCAKAKRVLGWQPQYSWRTEPAPPRQ
ncbi:MAG: NAD(P)-dependent oxidoreductase [Anaerolineae bacterium]|nr:NAD(P)-dependent oxidoreductase [Anaerolineae bacterium]